MTTTLQGFQPTISFDNRRRPTPPTELVKRYDDILRKKRFTWTVHHHLLRLLGEGGQGVVYLSERRGADGFTLPIALKIFSPTPFEHARDYDAAMSRIAHVAARVAQIQQDNLLDVHDFFDRHHIRLMVMEWIDGFDLRSLLSNRRLARIEHRVSESRWKHINEVIVTQGDEQACIKPGVAVAVVRDCLAALAALHRERVVHGDIKPANIMLKYTGMTKIIDIGSAFELDDPPPYRSCTPRYAAPEILEGQMATPQSDLASLGYVLIELLSGRRIFPEYQDTTDLLEQKRSLGLRLHTILPKEVTSSSLLMNFCQRLIAPDPRRRFADADAAAYVQDGAAAFHRQLIQGNLASEYESEIRVWIEAVKELEESA